MRSKITTNIRIDRSQYTNSSHGSGQLMSLGRLLLKRIPADPGPHLSSAASQLETILDRSQQLSADRIRNFGPGVAMMDREDGSTSSTRSCRRDTSSSTPGWSLAVGGVDGGDGYCVPPP